MGYPTTGPGYRARRLLNIHSTTKDGNGIELYAIHPGTGLGLLIFLFIDAVSFFTI